jgi:hypothetical protein
VLDPGERKSTSSREHAWYGTQRYQGGGALHFVELEALNGVAGFPMAKSHMLDITHK